MKFLITLSFILVLISLLYYLANPANHNGWNGGNAPAFNPRSKEGKIIHNVMQAIGVIVVWLILLAFIYSAMFT